MSNQGNTSGKHEHKFLPMEAAFSHEKYRVGYFILRWGCSIEDCSHEEFVILEAAEL